MQSKIKSRLKKGGFIIENLVKTNYFAAWIANFGVVPLFLFAAFLLAPAFFFFLNLLFVVTHVLETIRQLLSRYRCNISFFNDFKPSFVPINSLCVKGLIVILLFSRAQSSDASTKSLDIIIARGQSREISLPNLARFNISNHQTIDYRFNEKNKTLLIRGKSLGHLEILVWNKDKSVQSYQVYVISKSEESKLFHLAELISHLSLESEILIPHVLVTGTLKTLQQYLSYKKILALNKEAIVDQVEITDDLRSKIYSNIYRSFFDDYKDSIQCQSEYSEVVCSYPENEAPSDSLKKHLIDKYKISLVQNNNQQLKKNYLLRLKLIQLEQLDGEELRLGLEQLSGSLNDFLTIPMTKIVQSNQVLLSQKKVRISTLAEPQSLIRPQSIAEIQIGSEIPFKTTQAKETTSTDWKFAGLKIKINLENFGDKLKINYETEVTQPSNTNAGVSAIDGNKEKSSVIISLKTAVKIFQLSLRTEGKVSDQLPYLNAIPILGELFKSKSSQNNFKTITGIIEVIESDE